MNEDAKSVVSLPDEDEDEAEYERRVAPFLDFLLNDMTRNPQNIRPLDEGLMAKIERLVGGVEVDMDEDLGEDWLLEWT